MRSAAASAGWRIRSTPLARCVQPRTALVASGFGPEDRQRLSMAQTRERVPVVIVEYDQIARTIAERIARLIRERNAEGRPAVLGLATGSTPIGIYRELIRLHRDEGLDFGNVVTFNLDEYYPMPRESIHSYHRFMWEN